MATKINIFKDTIDIKEAKNFSKLLLFVIEKCPGIMLKPAYIITSKKIDEIYSYVSGGKEKNG